MLDVDHAEPQIPTRGELAQRVQQEDGIGAARHSDADALSSFEHAVQCDEFGDAIQHSVRMIPRRGKNSHGRRSCRALCTAGRRPSLLRRSPPASADQIDRSAQFYQRIIRGIDSIHARDGIEDGPLLLVRIVRDRRG